VREVLEHAGADALHAFESHVAGGFGKPADRRYIGMRGRAGIVARVVGLHELRGDAPELVGERREEILSSHLACLSSL
jgi:hypothetical protein